MEVEAYSQEIYLQFSQPRSPVGAKCQPPSYHRQSDSPSISYMHISWIMGINIIITHCSFSIHLVVPKFRASNMHMRRNLLNIRG